MTTVPLPSFLPADVLDDFEKFDGPLIYLAARWGIQHLPCGKTDSTVSTGTVDI